MKIGNHTITKNPDEHGFLVGMMGVALFIGIAIGAYMAPWLLP